MSVFAYFGGKSSSTFQDFINTKIPKDIKTYVEVFSGAMGTYMDDPSLFPEQVVYNDKNKHQVNLMFCCSKPELFLPHINSFKATELALLSDDPQKKWDHYKSIYQKWTKNDFLDNYDFEIGDYKKAAIYAFLITSSFSGVYPRGGGFIGYDRKKNKLKLDVLIKKLEKNTYTKKLSHISSFNCLDFETIINNYDSDDTFFYLDPPYFRPDESGYDDAKRLFWYGSDDDSVFGPASHRRLLELIKNTKGRWALSYYYFPLLEELLPKDEYQWFSKEVQRKSALGGNNHDVNKKHAMGVELLITNYLPE